jgi:hypothetical protein
MGINLTLLLDRLTGELIEAIIPRRISRGINSVIFITLPRQ